MAVLHTRLAAAATTTSLVILYTVPTGHVCKISALNVTNRENAANLLTMAILGPGVVVGGVTAADYIANEVSHAADTSTWTHFSGPEGLILGGGYSLAILGDDTNLTVSIYGSVGPN